jgi:hypothetical protein
MYFREWNFSARGNWFAAVNAPAMRRLDFFLLIGFD